MKSIEQNLLHEAKETLKEMTPSPMNTMLQKQAKEDAIKKDIERKQMKSVNVPPTTPGNAIIFGVSCYLFDFIFSTLLLIYFYIYTVVSNIQPKNIQGNVRRCTTCKNPMKGHKNVTKCPKNQAIENNRI